MTEHQSYHEIYNLYKKLVYTVAFNCCHDAATAESVTQDVFSALYIHYDKVDKEKVRAWLIVTAKNQALNYKKKQDRELLLIDDEKHESKELPATSFPSAEEEMLRREREKQAHDLHEKICMGLMETNPRWYQAVDLVYHLGMPQAEVAAELNMNLQSLHSMLHRVREWIRKEYGVEYHEMNQE